MKRFKPDTSLFPGDLVQELKIRLIDRFILIGACLGITIFIISLIPWDDSYINADFFIDIAVQLLILSIYFLRRKLSLNAKTIFLFSLIYIAFISDLLENGLTATGVSLVIFIPFLSIMVYNLRITIFVFAFCIFSYGVVSYFFITGSITPPDYSPSIFNVTDWINNISTIVLIALIISTFVYSYNESINRIISKLRSANHELKKRDQMLEESLEEKSVLLQEIHHRVKNNLAVVSGLLELQSYQLKEDSIKSLLKKSINRVMSIAKVHEMLYQSEDFNKIPFKQYVHELADIILNSMDSEDAGVQIVTESNIDFISVQYGVPLGIIFNELITNSLKYAFEGKTEKRIEIIVQQKGELIEVEYCDNGNGIKDFNEQVQSGLGFTIISSLMSQIEAEYEYDTAENFILKFSFKYANYSELGNDPIKAAS